MEFLSNWATWRLLNVPAGATVQMLIFRGLEGGIIRLVNGLTQGKIPFVLPGSGFALAALARTRPIVSAVGEGVTDLLAMSALMEGIEQQWDVPGWVTRKIGGLVQAGMPVGEGTLPGAIGGGMGYPQLGAPATAPALAAPQQAVATPQGQPAYITPVEEKIAAILAAD